MFGIAFDIRRQCHIHYLPLGGTQAITRTVRVDFCNDCLGLKAPEIVDTLRQYGFRNGTLQLTLTRGKPGINEVVTASELRHLDSEDGDTVVLRDGEPVFEAC